MRLTIIIVNYHSTNLISDCLKSIDKFMPGNDFEIIIVNNGCLEEDKHKFLAIFQDVIWLETGYNAGYSRANNLGMRHAEGDVLLLLNPDTLCVDNSISECLIRVANGKYDVAGVQLYSLDGKPQTSGSYFVHGGLNHLLPIPYWGDLIRWAGYKLNSKIPSVEVAGPEQDVDWINGAFIMVKKEFVFNSGMLDEDFFLYAEEIEWCSRLRQMGKLGIFGDLRMIHLEGATINKSQNLQEEGYYNLYDRKGLQLIVSNHLRVRKQYGVLWFLLLLINYTWGVVFAIICSIIKNLIKIKSPIKEINKLSYFARNVFILWTLTPTIIANKPHFYKMF